MKEVGRTETGWRSKTKQKDSIAAHTPIYQCREKMRSNRRRATPPGVKENASEGDRGIEEGALSEPAARSDGAMGTHHDIFPSVARGRRDPRIPQPRLFAKVAPVAHGPARVGHHGA